MIPIYNEEAFLGACLQRVAAADSAGLQKEIVAIDDGSSDRSWQRLRRFIRRRGKEKLVSATDSEERWQGEIDWIVRRWGKNRGKGAAVRRGIGLSRGEIVIIQDADLEYDPGDYPRLLAPIMAGQADAVYGSRFLGCRPHRVLYFNHYLGNKLLTWWSNLWTA